VSEPADEHPRCLGCDANVTVARRDGETLLVCHCTHDDGTLETVRVDRPPALLPSTWRWSA